MRQVKEEATFNNDTGIDFNLAVEELHGLTSQELSKLLKDSENYTVQLQTAKGLIQVDMEKFAWFLPLHLIAVLVSSDGDCRLRYLLKGVRLLHSLCDLASRNNRLEQILLEEVKVSEQILDLVFYILIFLAGYEKESRVGSTLPLLHSALVACSLHLLTGFISSQWQDLVHVLLVHPKVDTFMDVSFDAVRIDIRFFQIKLLALNSEVVCNKSSLPTAERTARSLCQQCEASLQLLQSLCQQKMFRERLLKNKELCRNGGILSLAQAILKFKIPSHFEEFSSIVAAICRLKSKILSILLQLCETESISYLDEVASSPRSMNVAKDFVFEILGILKATFSKEPKQLSDGLFNNKPAGFVLLNSMRLADILSDDSNFRSFIVTNITPILADVLSQPHEDFVCGWCSTNLQLMEEDATIEYDPFLAAGAALMSDTESEINATCRFIFNNMQPVSHAQQRTAFLVKIIANLHCFVPNICEEQEKDQFINKVLECLHIEPSKSSTINSSDPEGHKALTVCNNLGSLLDHALSLVPSFLNEEDVQLLSVFSEKLQGLIPRVHDGNNSIKDPDVKDVEMIQDEDLCLNSQNQLGRRNFQDVNNVNASLTSGSSLYAVPKCSYDLLLMKERVPCGKETAVRPTRILDTIDTEGASNFNGKMVTSGCDVGFMKRSNNIDQIFDPVEFRQLREHVKENGYDAVLENEKIEVSQGEEKQMKKRKRNIMNEKQIKLIENALVDEPEMQRNAAMVQLWADKLSSHGSEITSSQLKNWLNNRKAKLARAAREARPLSEGENAMQDKACGSSTVPSYDSPESPGDDFYAPVAMTRTSGNNTAKYEFVGADYNDFSSQQNMQNLPTYGFVRCEPGQYVALVDGEGKEICRGQVYQVEGRWHGKCLEEAGICVVDVIDLKVDRWTRIPHPLESAGTTFDEAEAMHGLMRVAWDASKIFLLHP